MAFVFETLTKQESEKLQKEYGLRDFSTEDSVYPEWQVIDRDSDAVLVPLRTGEPKTVQASGSVIRFSYFEFIWKNKHTQIQCSEDLNPKQGTVQYAFNQATADPSLEPKRDELIELVEEAFIARQVEYKRRTFAFRNFYSKLGDKFHNIYFDGKKMVDVTIKPKFSFALDTSNSSKILVDKVHNATLEFLGFSGGSEHFQLTIDGHPVYLRRKCFVFMSDVRQVLWSFEQMLASHELYSDKDEQRRVHSDIAYAALETYGFGGVEYLRGPSRIIKNPGIEYASAGTDVIALWKQNSEAPNIAREHVSKSHTNVAAASSITYRQEPTRTQSKLLVRVGLLILAVGLLFVLVRLLGK
jgi:hypothetical protein